MRVNYLKMPLDYQGASLATHVSFNSER
jgi:hypothetical protein